MARAAAEMDPNDAICSRRSILPGPMRPSGSRLMRRLSDGISFSLKRCACRPPILIESHRLDDGKNRLPWLQAERIEGLSGDPGKDCLAVAVDADLDQRPAPAADRRDGAGKHVESGKSALAFGCHQHV